MAFNFEKIADVNFTGTNTKMGSLITFKLKETEGNLADTEQVQEIFVNLVSKSVVELTKSGAIVFD